MKKAHEILNHKFVTAILWSATAVFVAFFIYAFFGESILGRVPVLDQTLFEILAEIWPRLLTLLATNFGKFISVVFLVIILACWILRQNYRTRILLITHATIGKDINISEAFEKAHYCKKIDIAQTPQNTEELIQLLREQDEIIAQLIHDLRNNKRPLYYCGIAHTPLIFRLGYQLHGKRVRFLHQARIGKIEHRFSALNASDEDKTPNNKFEEDLISGARELLVGISATYMIKETELDTIDPSRSIPPFFSSSMACCSICARSCIASNITSFLSARLYTISGSLTMFAFLSSLASANAMILLFSFGVAVKSRIKRGLKLRSISIESCPAA